ncbi:SPL family radical SAM protein [Haladaptatus salinisoli]|uniref:SPL family radical SAM protein n=1 Tax=Haladaptatus salinisoli TaxID=2884876 RepID=UPI001D0B0A5A|nr:radical SAM protein [Haladaptatus salinisoli]
MRLQQESNGSHYLLSGEAQDNLGSSPTLDTLREADRKHGDPLDRLDILDANLNCSKCGSELTERFSAAMNGQLLCWQCAMSDTADTTNEITRTTDSAKVVLSKSNLFHKSLCDYVINVATGCTHGCKFCYVPSTPGVSARGDMLGERADVEDVQRDWGGYLLYRDDLPERLGRKLERKRKWKWTERGQGVVMLSSGTDCYQDRRTAQITRGCVAELVEHRIPVRILTRSPAVCRDIDLYQRATELTDDGMLVRVGSSIPCLEEEQVRAIEPRAPVPSARLNALQKLSDAGVPVYVSMSPTYPTQDRDDFESLIQKFAQLDPEVVFHEPINPRGANFDMTVEAAREAGETELANELAKLRDREYWVDYSLKQMRWAEELGDEYGVNVHIWPDKQVITSVDSETETELRNQRKRPSGEIIPDVPLPT